VSLTLLRQQVQTAVAAGFGGYDSQAFPFEGVSEDRDLVSVWIVDLNEQSDDVIVQQVAVAVRVSPRWVPNPDLGTSPPDVAPLETTAETLQAALLTVKTAVQSSGFWFSRTTAVTLNYELWAVDTTVLAWRQNPNVAGT
jgi:hypothetical protein